MKNLLSNFLQIDPLYTTERIVVKSARSVDSKDDLITSVSEIMSPNVVKALPDGWHNLDTVEKAKRWVEERHADSHFYVICLSETNDIVGYLFLYTASEFDGKLDLRLGYLLRESSWGKGIGSELIQGLIKWAKNSKKVTSISGGVEKENLGSIRVLEKNGFKRSSDKLPEGMLLYELDFPSQ